MEQTKLCRNSSHRETLPIADFNKNKRNPDGLQQQCRACQRKSDKKHYDENLHRRKSVRDAAKRTQIRREEYIFEYLLSHSCVDCGENNPVVLEFDHKDSKLKTDTICDLVRSKSFIKLQQEIEKCEIRCANCHRIKTAKQFNYYTYRIQKQRQY